MTQICCVIVRIVGVLSNLKVSNVDPVDLFCDNKAVIQIAINPIFHERMKHIKIDCHLVRDYLTKWVIAAEFVPSYSQQEDMFTKFLNSLMLNKMNTNLGLVDFFQVSGKHRSEAGC